uniref:MULE transposase domain-containing protein n=1 Tax=Chenopodium quinoa TaxID=63459 RepID=A0A803LM64_CHEQI
MRFLNVDPSEIGMIFDSWQEIDVYFNAYGKQQGFGVVRGQSAYKHFKDGSKIKREVTWKCDCAGKPDTQRKVGGKRIAREFEGEPVATKKSKKMWLRGHVVWWMFSTWLDVVGGDPPTAILTGQDPAMRKALKAVMPQTRHRWCLWHITEKFCVKLGKCKGNTRLWDFAEKYVAAMEQRLLSKRLADVEEDRRQKEEHRKKYAAKKARDERARKKATAKENTDECVVETPQSPHTFTNSIQVSEDTVGNDIMVNLGYY